MSKEDKLVDAEAAAVVASSADQASSMPWWRTVADFVLCRLKWNEASRKQRRHLLVTLCIVVV